MAQTLLAHRSPGIPSLFTTISSLFGLVLVVRVDIIIKLPEMAKPHDGFLNKITALSLSAKTSEI